MHAEVFDEPMNKHPPTSRARTTFSVPLALGPAAAILLSACATAPTPGADDMVIKGAAAGEKAVDAGAQLERCPSPLGTVGLADTGDPFVPIVRTMVQQSNCFLVVERGRAYGNVDLERQLKEGGLTRGEPTQKEGGGALLAADYTLVPSVTFAEPSGFGLTTGLGGFFGRGGNKTDTSVQLQALGASASLLLVHNGSGAQIVAAQGSAKNYNVGAGVGILGGLIAGVNAYASTPEGKIVAAAFLDAYNKLVGATQQYEAQTATGAVGKGGALASP